LPGRLGRMVRQDRGREGIRSGMRDVGVGVRCREEGEASLKVRPSTYFEVIRPLGLINAEMD